MTHTARLLTCVCVCVCVNVPQVRRFIRYNLGEGLEKKANDFAAEVAQQTQAKAAAPAAPAPPKKEEPKKEEAPKKPAVQVCALLRLPMGTTCMHAHTCSLP